MEARGRGSHCHAGCLPPPHQGWERVAHSCWSWASEPKSSSNESTVPTRCIHREKTASSTVMAAKTARCICKYRSSVGGRGRGRGEGSRNRRGAQPGLRPRASCAQLATRRIEAHDGRTARVDVGIEIHERNGLSNHVWRVEKGRQRLVEPARVQDDVGAAADVG